MQAILQLHSRSTSVCLPNVDADEIGLEETGILLSAMSKKDSGHQVVRLHHECRGLHQIGSAEYPVIVCRRLLSLFSHVAQLRICQIMYRPKQFCAWHATSGTEFHPSQTGAYHGAVPPSPGCTRFVETVVSPLETPLTALGIGPCMENVRYALLDLALTTRTTTTGVVAVLVANVTLVNYSV